MGDNEMKTTVAVLAAIALAGCAAPQQIVDTKGVDMARYDLDVRECEAYAGQVDVGGTALAGAGGGALLGAVLGAVVDGGRGAAFGAKVGAVQGGAGGAATGFQARRQVARECLRGRGYRVLL
jgi:outer membrane lipoprotein SlyB